MSIVWDQENAAHLLRRAGFAATPEAVLKTAKKSQKKAVDGLFSKKKIKDGPPKGGFESREQLQTWWVRRMVKGSPPLLEKLCLFWHNHFATGISKVESPTYMHEQNRLIRKRAFGKFRDMVTDMTRDVAMLIWLDNRTNVAADPNENYARELMELFTTGVLDADGNPNYTEMDVVESARAFTGWQTKWQNGRLYFEFKPWNHDYGVKTFRGVTGKLDGTDVIENLVLDPATPRRLAMKLFSFFARPVDLDDPLLDPMVQAYLDNDTAIEPMLRVMFMMDEFYATASKLARVKSPAEWVANVLILLKAHLNKKDKTELGTLPTDMGQELFDPPSVFGWDEGLPWVQTGGLLDRARLAQDVAGAREKTDFLMFNPGALLGSKKKWSKFTAEQTVDRVLSRLGPPVVTPTTRDALVAYVDSESTAEAPFELNGASIDLKVRGLTALVLSMPEFQVH